MVAGVKTADRLVQLIRSPSQLAVLFTFAAGVAIRIVLVALYRPAFLGITDAGSYINAAHIGLFTNVYDPAGYPLFIRLIHDVYASLSLLILVQHVLGVTTAGLLYLTVRRVTNSVLLGLIPAGIVLLDGYGLWVEHTPISDTLFAFLVVAALSLALVTAERTRWLLAGEGVLIAAGAVVRPVGLILLPVIAVWIFANRPERARARALAVGMLIAPAFGLLAGYVLLQRADTGFVGMTPASGRVLYARAAGFADCSKFTPPPGTASLCEATPASRRGSPNQYLTGFPDHASAVTAAMRSISPAWRVFGSPPAGNQKLAAFGVAAIIHQPLDYLSHVTDDFHYYWADHHRAFFTAAADIQAGVESAVIGYYATGVNVHTSGLGFLRWYGKYIELTGALTIVVLLLSLTGPMVKDRRVRCAALLFASTGWLLPLGADAVATVDPRYVLPAYGPLAASAAIGLRRDGLRRVIRVALRASWL